MNNTLLMGRPIIRPTVLKKNQGQVAKPTVKLKALKQKQGQLLVKNTNKQARKNYVTFDFYYVFDFFEMRIVYVLKSLV